MLISVEGVDGSCGTTICDFIQKFLEERMLTVIRLKEPEQPYRDILLHDKHTSPREEVFAFMASRARLYEQVVIPSLEKGKFVLCDRSIDSTIAYQAFASGYIGPNLCNIFNLYAINGRKPDLTILLDLDPQIACRRKPYGDDNFEKRGFDFMNKVRYAYGGLATKEPERIKMIDASLNIEKVKSRVKGLLESMLRAKGKENEGL